MPKDDMTLSVREIANRIYHLALALENLAETERVGGRECSRCAGEGEVEVFRSGKFSFFQCAECRGRGIADHEAVETAWTETVKRWHMFATPKIKDILSNPGRLESLLKAFLRTDEAKKELEALKVQSAEIRRRVDEEVERLRARNKELTEALVRAKLRL